jgi:hypothetical protein
VSPETSFPRSRVGTVFVPLRGVLKVNAVGHSRLVLQNGRPRSFKETRLLQAEVRQFEGRILRLNRPRVTSAIVLACVVVFVAMAVSTRSLLSPSLPQLLACGGDSGPSVMLEHEYWRLLLMPRMSRDL